MIIVFKHKGLRAYYEKGNSKGINQKQASKINMILTALEIAEEIEELNIPAFYFHALKGYNPKRYSIRISGNWRMTFEWSNRKADKIDLEDYH